MKGKVLVGNSGGELGVRGWGTALDAATGQRLWQALSTGPDADVLIGPSFEPFYAQDRGKDLGSSSWPGDSWKIGVIVWGFLAYDPQLVARVATGSGALSLLVLVALWTPQWWLSPCAA